MNTRDQEVLSGAIFDEGTEITVVELCRVCSIDSQLVEQLIHEGILEPRGQGDTGRLPYSAVRRTQTVVHLQRDLGVNIAGAALALELLDTIEQLRARLRPRH